MLLCTRLLMGAAEGGIMPISQSLIASDVDARHRGLAMGVAQGLGSSLLGSFVAPVMLVAFADGVWLAPCVLSRGAPGLADSAADGVVHSRSRVGGRTHRRRLTTTQRRQPPPAAGEVARSDCSPSETFCCARCSRFCWCRTSWCAGPSCRCISRSPRGYDAVDDGLAHGHARHFRHAGLVRDSRAVGPDRSPRFDDRACP